MSEKYGIHDVVVYDGAEESLAEVKEKMSGDDYEDFVENYVNNENTHGAYIDNLDKIVIFANKIPTGHPLAEAYISVLVFHEGIHHMLHTMPEEERERIIDTLKDFIGEFSPEMKAFCDEHYSENENIDEEYITNVLDQVLGFGSAYRILKASEGNENVYSTLNEIFNYFNYDTERERIEIGGFRTEYSKQSRAAKRGGGRRDAPADAQGEVREADGQLGRETSQDNGGLQERDNRVTDEDDTTRDSGLGGRRGLGSVRQSDGGVREEANQGGRENAEVAGTSERGERRENGQNSGEEEDVASPEDADGYQTKLQALTDEQLADEESATRADLELDIPEQSKETIRKDLAAIEAEKQRRGVQKSTASRGKKPTKLQRLAGEAVVEQLRSAGIEVSMDAGKMREALEESAGHVQEMAVEEANRRFNEQLDEFEKGDMRSSDKFELGTPGAILLAAGLPDLPFGMTQSVLRNHMEKHNLAIADIKGLVRAMQNPMMVYKWGSKVKSNVIVTNLTTSDGRKIAVAVKIGEDGAGQEINEIASVHGKTKQRLIDAINSEKSNFGTDNLRYVDKKKALEWFAVEAPLASSQTNQELDSAAKIVENFENPVISNEILQKMTVYHGSPYSFDAFDHANMGNGEGAQAHGWGTYVAKSEVTGRVYADASGSPSDNISLRQNMRDTLSEKELRMLDALLGEMLEDKKYGESYEESLMRLQSDGPRYRYGVADADEIKAFANRFTINDFSGAETRNLYEVEIPEDDGTNYIDEDKPLTTEQKSRIEKALRKLGVDLEDFAKRGFTLDDNGRDVYGGLLNYGLRGTTAEKVNAQEATSRFLKKLGFVGIKYDGRQDGECYVIFDEKDAKIKSHIQFLRLGHGMAEHGKLGDVYGFVKDGKIYLDPTLLNPNTPIHEYSHLWDNAVQKANPELWAKGVELMKAFDGGRLWDEVKNDPNYADIASDDNLVASEVKARLTGKKGAAYFERAAKEAAKSENLDEQMQKYSIIANVKKWLKDMWNATKQWLLGKSAFTDKWSKEELAKLKAEDFANMTLRDLMEGVNPKEEASRVVGETDRGLTSGTVQKRFVGEKGAERADKTEGSTRRMDNLRVAERMERKLSDEVEQKKMRIEKLRKSEPVEITGDEYKGQYELNRASAQQWIKDNLRGVYTNSDTGETIELRKDGAQKVTSHSMGNEAHLKSIAAIPQLIEKSIFIDELPNEKGSGKYDSYRYYVCGIKIGGEDYTAKVTVGVKGKNKYYDHSLTQIEKGNLIDNIDALSPTFDANETSSVSVGKDTKLRSILQANEQENARKMKLATGWERGADGKWRYEEPDGNISRNAVSRYARRGVCNFALNDFWEDKALFDAYPELQQWRIRMDGAETENKGRDAYCAPVDKEIVISHRTIKEWHPETIIHEIQHAIQYIEGFASGGSSSMTDDYHNLAGEVEARNASRRMDMTNDERRSSLAEETEDVPRDKQIVMHGNEADASIQDNTNARREGESLFDYMDRMADVAKGKIRKSGLDQQGNPIGQDGKLVLEEVASIDELTDKDFTEPTRNVKLPQIPKNIDEAIGANGKPVVIKKNVFEKNAKTHSELSPSESKEILKSALYSPHIVGTVQPIKRPDYRVAIHLGDKNSVVVLDVYAGKENVEIVGWRKVDAKGPERMKKQAEREDGQLLILSPETGSAAALSALPSDASDAAKVAESSETAKDSGGNVQFSFGDGDPEARKRAYAAHVYESRVSKGVY